MALEAKICGLKEPESIAAALAGGADYLGFNFFPPSPRYLAPDLAASLAARIPEGPTKVALFVDPDDALLAEVLAQAPIDLIQLQGSETPRRVAEIRARFGKPVMKAVKIATRADLDEASAFEAVADRMLFDAKAPKSMKNALPGGNAIAFDWRLLAGRRWSRPWMLAGGLKAETLAEATEVSGARAVDVSSGVESAPGQKDPALIRAFLETAKRL